MGEEVGDGKFTGMFKAVDDKAGSRDQFRVRERRGNWGKGEGNLRRLGGNGSVSPEVEIGGVKG